MKSLLLKTIAFSILFLLAHPVAAQTWTRMRNAPAAYWISVASSADGAKLYSASWTGNLMASTNSGATWNTKLSNQWVNFYRMTCSPDGTKVAVADYKNPISYSGDSGATWSGLGRIGWWFGVACSADADLIVGISQGTPRTGGFIEYATNYPGIFVWRGWPANPNLYSNFAVSNNLPLEPWEAVACSTDGTKIVAVGKGAVFTTADSGSTWNQQALGYTDLDWSSVASSADGTKLVAIASGQIYTSSSSGTGWALTPAPTANWIQVASSADGTRLVGVIYGGGIYTSWDSGATWRLNNAPNAYWAAVASSGDGRKLVAVVYGGGIYTAELPPLIAAMSATPPRVRTGTNIQVLVAVENNDTNTINNIVVSGGIAVTGAGGVTLITDNSASMLTTLVPGQSTSFTNIYQATNSGNVTFTATVRGSTVIGPEPDSICSSQVLIVPNGDLLIKRAVESADDYAGLGVFQTVPNSPQVKTNVVANTNDLSQFQVQIQNNDPQTQTFTLLAGEGGNPVWKRTFLLAGADVTAQVEVPGGMTLPPMAPGTALTLSITVQDTNASPGDLSLVEFALGLASDTSFFLDTVEAVTLLVPVILVNSTGDLPMQDPNGCCCDTGRKLAGTNIAECTLRAAIQLANRNPGKDIIKFQIPAGDPGIVNGVPSIQPKTALPDITDSVVIDGWSQSPAASHPPVEFSGIALTSRGSGGSLLGRDGVHPENLIGDLANGLHVVADGCEIRGLVVNSFPNCGVLVDGPNTIIQGNFFGLDPSGTLSEPSGIPVWFEGDVWELRAAYWYEWEGGRVRYRAAHAGPRGGGGAQVCVRSPGNLIGGTDPQARNIISGGPNYLSTGGAQTVSWVGAPGLVLLGAAANGNVVEGNLIGLDVSARHAPYFLTAQPGGSGQYAGIWISGGSGNRVGGPTAGAANIIAGNLVGVQISGDGATGNVIAGNQIGWSAVYRGDFNTQAQGVEVESGAQQNTVGGSAAGAGNVIGGTGIGITDGGGSTTIQGNWIGIQSDGKTAIPARYGISATFAQSSQIAHNTIANIANIGISLQSSPACRVFGNRISACASHGIAVAGGCHGVMISLNSISGNGNPTLRFENGNGIYITDGNSPVTISQNSISASAVLGIGFKASGSPLLNSNGAQPVRILFSHPPPLFGNGQLKITGALEASAGGGTYLLEFFGSAVANRSGYGEGQTFLGSAAVTADLLGNGVINVTFPSPKDPGQYLTATATAPDGSTTEFSRAVLIQPCTPGIKGICPGIETNVPSLVGHSGQIRPMAVSFGDGNGDGIQDWLQSNVASLPSLPGLWVTLAAPNGTVLENVTPTAVPDYTSLPVGYIFPIGFLSFGITNLPANGKVTITNFLHLGAAPGFAYAATTYFNFGPTPDNHTPHWYEFLFNGTNGVELFPDRIILHLRDGARGDHDVSVNGEIVTVGAPAYQLPPTPQLAISLVSVGSSNIVDILAGTNDNFSLVTNPVPVVTCVLSWPTNENNYLLEFQNDLSLQNLFDGLPALLWQTVPETTVIVNGRNFVTNTTIGSTGFYRLSPNVVVATASGPVLLSIQLTAANTVVFSWPASASGFGLQQNSDLGTTKWVDVTNAVIVVGGNYQVIPSPASGRRFYRLMAQ